MSKIKNKNKQIKYFFSIVTVFFLLITLFVPTVFANSSIEILALGSGLENPLNGNFNTTFNGSSGSSKFSTFADFLGIFTNIFNYLIPILVTAALAGFLWGIAKMVLKADDASAREEGRKAMVFGIFALFALVSVWGIALAVRRTFFGF